MNNLFLKVLFYSLIILCVGHGGTIHAQEQKKIDSVLLIELFEAKTKRPNDTYIDKRIEDERQNIRDVVLNELNALIQPSLEEENLDEAGISKALERQKNVIKALEERLKERKVDLDLLQSEEIRFYLSPPTDTGALAGPRITKSYEELLSRKLILEERIGIIESLLPLQRERLEKLVYEQRIQNFSALIAVGKLLLMLFLVWLLERGTRRYILSYIKNRDRRFTMTKLFSSAVYISTIAVLLGMLFSRNPGVLASFAIVGAGLAISLQDLVKNILGWMVIQRGKLFSKGDRITIGGVTGEVVDTNVLHTTLLEIGTQGVLETTGKTLLVPNFLFLSQVLVNHTLTSDFVKLELHITITFESNWKKAKEILDDVLEEETKEYEIAREDQYVRRTFLFYVPHESKEHAIYTEIGADGVVFTLRFTVPVRERRIVSSKVAQQILHRFDQESDIEFAYKTTRYYVPEGGEQLHS